jgi:hypothetical protein
MPVSNRVTTSRAPVSSQAVAREIEPNTLGELRQQFVDIASRFYPALTEELVRDVLPVAVEGLQADRSQFTRLFVCGEVIRDREHYQPLGHALRGWAEKWDGARNEWLVLAALGTVEAWARGAPQHGRIVLPEPPRRGATEYARQILEAQERLKDFRAQPQRIDLAESDADAERRALVALMRDYRRWRKVLREQSSFRPPRTISELDLQRTVRYHLGRETFAGIAAREGIRGKDTSDAVKRSVHRVKTELQLWLRDPDKPGRPRKQQAEMGEINRP